MKRSKFSTRPVKEELTDLEKRMILEDELLKQENAYARYYGNAMEEYLTILDR